LVSDGDHQIQIKALNGISGDYAMVLMDAYSSPIVFPGNLDYGDQSSHDLAPDTEHIWHFQGTAGDNIEIRVDPDDNFDVFFELYQPGGLFDLIDLVDDGAAGQIEFHQFVLSETGFYSILVGEDSDTEASYQVSLILD